MLSFKDRLNLTLATDLSDFSSGIIIQILSLFFLNYFHQEIFYHFSPMIPEENKKEYSDNKLFIYFAISYLKTFILHHSSFTTWYLILYCLQ